MTARLRFSCSGDSAEPDRLRTGVLLPERDLDLDPDACDCGVREPDFLERDLERWLPGDFDPLLDRAGDPLLDRAGLPLFDLRSSGVPLRDFAAGVPLLERDFPLPPEACELLRDLPDRCEPAALPPDFREAFEPLLERCDPAGLCERDFPEGEPDRAGEFCPDPDRLDAADPDRLRFCGVPERLRFWGVPEPLRLVPGEFDRELLS